MLSKGRVPLPDLSVVKVKAIRDGGRAGKGKEGKEESKTVTCLWPKKRSQEKRG